MSKIEWAEKHRFLSKEESDDYAGKFRLENVPALRGLLSACSDPDIKAVIAQKSAQIAFTSGVVCTLLGYYSHWEPCVQVVLFPRNKSATDFNAEKFEPMVRASPALAKLINLKSRSAGNSNTRKHYPGGLIKFVASNSPSDVKSTTARVIIVEEPDDVSRDVRGQGSSIALLRERAKTVSRSFELIGGTPTLKGFSTIEVEMESTDKRRFMVACHLCEEEHEIEWEHVVIPGFDLSKEELADPEVLAKYPERGVYGRARHEDAYYVCPNCGGIWSDADRVSNIRKAARTEPHYGWQPTAAASGRVGFYFNELQSTFRGSYVPIIAEKFLKAWRKAENGDQSEMIAFENSVRGRLWEFAGDLPAEEDLATRAEQYEEWTVPDGAYVPLAGVDVQHDRLAVAIWVFGKGSERWLAYWGELHGDTRVANQGAWIDLDALMDRTIRHESGVDLIVAGLAIDCSDGQTSDAAYSFCRKHDKTGRPVKAIKGASDDTGRVEIWTKPKPIDPARKPTKAAKYGVKLYQVGTAKAKDLIIGWGSSGGLLRLEGSGPGRMHWYESVRPDFYEQILSEVKIPSPTNPKKRVWAVRKGRRNEALDCTVYAEWLSRAMRLHLRKDAQWDVVANSVRAKPKVEEAIDAEQTTVIEEENTIKQEPNNSSIEEKKTKENQQTKRRSQQNWMVKSRKSWMSWG